MIFAGALYMQSNYPGSYLADVVDRFSNIFIAGVLKVSQWVSY